MTTETLNAPVCRYCGADADSLHAIERAVSWRYVNWQYNAGEPERPVPGRPDAVYPAVAPGWYPGDEWGDDVGETDAQTVGIACGNCDTEYWFDPPEGTAGEPSLITTRGAYNRTHPFRTWRVPVERHVRAQGPSEPPFDPLTGQYNPDHVGPPRDGVERRTRRVRARDARSAELLVSQMGMQGRGSNLYPWRVAYGTHAELVR